MKNPIKILVVDDDPQTRRVLKAGFELEMFKVFTAGDGEAALAIAAKMAPEVVILSFGMPNLDGFKVCSQLRKWSNVPLIAISYSNDEIDKIAALDLGVDDYVVKPFSVRELQARVKAVLRRTAADPVVDLAIFSCEGLKIDYSKKLVTVDENIVHLSPKEYELLQYMARNANIVLTAHRLTGKLWGKPVAFSHTLRVHVANLRRKLEKDLENPRYILTEVHVGYRFRTEFPKEIRDEDRKGKVQSSLITRN